jgi:hypothetical protein
VSSYLEEKKDLLEAESRDALEAASEQLGKVLNAEAVLVWAKRMVSEAEQALNLEREKNGVLWKKYRTLSDEVAGLKLVISREGTTS